MLKTKMFLSFSIVSLLIVGITCGLFYWKYTSDIMNQSFSLSGIISKQFSEISDLYIQNIEELSLAVSIAPPVQSNLLDYRRATSSLEKEIFGYKLSPFLFDFSYPKPYVQGISIYTLDGYMYDYTKRVEQKNAAPYPREELARLAETLQTRKFMLRPSAGREGGGEPPERIVSFIRRINQIPTQQVIGYVNIDINVNAFKALVLASTQTNVLENTMRVLIVDDGGTIIYENDGMNDGSSEPFDMGLLKPSTSLGELVWEGVSYLYTFQSSDYTGWKTVILIPKDMILLKQKRIQDIILVVGLITMLLIASVSYILSHQITLPLRNMMRKMSSVELGDFSQRMEYTGKNEIGKLSRMYNLMLSSISRLIHEVYESKLAEKNAQLSALHAQINPHFLYNTLNIMKSISRLRGIEEVAEISESLAGLFQYSMKNLHQPVTLLEEIEHIHNYFKIQQHRFGDRLELSCDVPEHLLQAKLLKLTIQPLVENAVNHGLRRMRSGGKIRIAARQEDRLLTIAVADNGAGIAASKLAELSHLLESMDPDPLLGAHAVSNGIGLMNIHQRIRLFYGKSYGLKLTGSSGGGTIVTVSIPYLLVRQEEAEGSL